MIGVILLAAGRSRRFGGDKRRHVLPDGRSMLTTTVALYQQVFPAVRLVIAPRDDGLLRELGIDLRPTDSAVVAADADLGMGHSLAAGMQGLDWSFTFIALADMPFTNVQTLRLLTHTAESAAPDAVIIPTHGGRRGHPVGFGPVYYPALCHLRGDEGARAVLSAAGKPVLVEVPDAGVLEDLDRPPGD